VSQQNRSNGFRGEFFDKGVDKFFGKSSTKKPVFDFRQPSGRSANTGCFSDLLAVYLADE